MRLIKMTLVAAFADCYEVTPKEINSALMRSVGDELEAEVIQTRHIEVLEHKTPDYFSYDEDGTPERWQAEALNVIDAHWPKTPGDD